MPALQKLWVILQTGDQDRAGTDATMYLEVRNGNKTITLSDRPGDDLEQGITTNYLFSVDDLTTNDFVSGPTVLRNGNNGDNPGWLCASVLIVGIDEDGKSHPLVAMPEVGKWLADDSPDGLELLLTTL